METFVNVMVTAIKFVFVCIFTIAFIIVPPSVIIDAFGLSVFSVLISLFWCVIAVVGIIWGVIRRKFNINSINLGG